MEVLAVGSVADAQAAQLLHVLAALSGQVPAAVDIHEMVMRCEGAGRKDLHLTLTALPSHGALPPAHSWSAHQYGQPPWGDKALEKLPAGIRTVTSTPCTGPNVLLFWNALGFTMQYQYCKQGRTVDVHRGGHVLHILVSRVRHISDRAATGTLPDAVPQGAGADVAMEVDGTSLPAANGLAAGGTEAPAVVPPPPPPAAAAAAAAAAMPGVVLGGEVVPGRMLVETWTLVSDNEHTSAVAAVTELAKLLRPHGVELQPPPKARGRGTGRPGPPLRRVYDG